MCDGFVALSTLELRPYRLVKSAKEKEKEEVSDVRGDPPVLPLKIGEA